MNSIQLIGRLTADPELRFTNGGTATCTIRLAVPRRKKDGVEPAPVYVDVVTFGPQAEAVANYMAKGRRVAVVGRLSHQEWTDDDGDKHSRLQVLANSVDFLDRPAKGNGDANVTFAPGEEPF